MDRITVLCVDDDPDLVAMTSSSLEATDERFDTLVETDPREAIERVETEPVDCIVSDYEMPAMNGLELFRSVRSEYAKLPFILFTGRGDGEVASAAVAQGVTDFFRKGADSGQYARLAQRIANAVQGQHTRPRTSLSK